MTAIASIILTSPEEGNMGSEDFRCAVWASYGEDDNEQIAELRLQDGSLKVEVDADQLPRVMTAFPIANSLHLHCLIVGALGAAFTTECETYADAFAEGQIFVLGHG